VFNSDSDSDDEEKQKQAEEQAVGIAAKITAIYHDHNQPMTLKKYEGRGEILLQALKVKYEKEAEERKVDIEQKAEKTEQEKKEQEKNAVGQGVAQVEAGDNALRRWDEGNAFSLGLQSGDNGGVGIAMQAKLKYDTTKMQTERRLGEECRQNTNFRKAEERYKLKRPTRGSSKSLQHLSTEFDNVIDFDRGQHVNRLIQIADGRTPVYTLQDRAGFFYLPGAVPTLQAMQWFQACFCEVIDAPSRTNHSACLGELPGLLSAANNKLIRTDSGWETVTSKSSRQVPSKNSAETLLRTLRWATMGPMYNWTSREYDRDLPYQSLPEEMANFATSMAKLAADGARATNNTAPFEPDAALVSYYRDGDRLGGHIDDVENDMAQPIVSVSLGCDAIFLIGGTTRDDEPHALRLRNGDTVILSGAARRYFHGVPRVIAQEQNGASGGADGVDGGRGVASLRRTTRVNISIRHTK
jgi:alkylated DNA repair protein alkB family protein 1